MCKLFTQYHELGEVPTCNTDHTHKIQTHTQVCTCMHHTHCLSNSWWERMWHCVLHQGCCTAAAHIDLEKNHTCIRFSHCLPHSPSFSFSRVFLLSLISYCTACPLWLWHLSLSAVAESWSNVFWCCPARANPRRDLGDTHHIESQSSSCSGALAAQRWHCLFRGERKQIDWAAILQLLMLTHPVHYQRGRDPVSAPHLLPLLLPFQGYP